MRSHPLGIYEKALPKTLSWPERLALAKSCGFDFVEMSIDETDERLSRLSWSASQRAALVEAMLESGVAIPSMCLSAHRRFPFGSRCRRHAPGSGGVVPGLGLPTADADEGGQQNQSSAGHEADCDGLAAEADGERRGEDRLERHE